MRTNRCLTVLSALFLFTLSAFAASPEDRHSFRFTDLAARWDEAVPLGNGMLGALVWGENAALRFSLDRADLWDTRPIPNFQKPEFRFPWILEQINAGSIGPVQNLIDRPYDRDPAPTKIPAGRLEFDTSGWGEVDEVSLDIKQALCTVKWKSGVVLTAFVHAAEPVGWIRIEGATEPIRPRIVPPPFGGETANEPQNADSLSGHLLSTLGYPAPVMEEGEGTQLYRQAGWGGFEFGIACAWKTEETGAFLCAWTVRTNAPNPAEIEQSLREMKHRLQGSDSADVDEHRDWWNRFWEKSSISLPDPAIETQWYREQYKFGSAARRGAPPISLQAVWTADERRVPPWKGDYHHDLNTQLSYWPCYSGNHLEEGLSYTDWLWKVKPAAEQYTRRFYGIDGLNYHGITTIEGEPMGGWNQYSCSPTTAAWLAQHFYLHWRYSMDRGFLKIRAYPFLRDAAKFLEQHSIRDENGRRGLPLSSSPEIHDNRLEAWFRQTTNYDLALAKWLFGAAAELAMEEGLHSEAQHWSQVRSEWPDLALDPEQGFLLVAPGEPLRESHRHFSHLMAIHPLGLYDGNQNEKARHVIESSLRELERLGTDYWCGYSYAWLGNLHARARQGEKAAAALRTFAECFVSTNSFHLNGDQSGTGKSKMTYRPFTLEGNFAFAAGVQEMLLQSHHGVIRVFPAVPSDWRDIGFETLRAEGAILVSAKRREGRTVEVTLQGEKSGTVRLENPFPGKYRFEQDQMPHQEKDGLILFDLPAGHAVTLRAEE